MMKTWAVLFVCSLALLGIVFPIAAEKLQDERGYFGYVATYEGVSGNDGQIHVLEVYADQQLSGSPEP